MIIMVVGTSAVNFFISRQVLDQSIQERLVDTVSSNAQEIEYRSSVSGEREAQDFFLSYNGGVLEIDDDFLNYSEGIYTALIDSDNNLLYGELPVRLNGSQAFSYAAVGSSPGGRIRHNEKIVSAYRRHRFCSKRNSRQPGSD